MTPVLAVLLGAAAVGGGYVAVKELTKPKPLDPSKLPLVPGGPPGLVDKLQKDRTYAAQVIYDWSKIPGAVPATPDKEAAANYIKAVFGGSGEQAPGLGFKVLSTPQLRDEAEAKKFFAGQPSSWVFNVQWLKDEPHVKMDAATNKVFPNAAFFILPVA